MMKGPSRESNLPLLFPDEPFPSSLTGIVANMTTLRIRGLYAAALTSLFQRYAPAWEVVQPDDEIRARLPGPWRSDSPDVEIDDHPETRGTRDTIRLIGAGHQVRQAVQILQQHCIDVITHESSSQLGSIYMGLVGLVSRVRRRAIVYLGGNLAGILPLNQEDREIRIGSYIPVRIEALTSENDDRLQLSNTITVPGHYAVLTMTPAVRISKQITDTEARERLQRIGSAQQTSGWGIIWRTAAQDAEEAALVEEIHHLVQQAQGLRESIAATQNVGYVQGGEVNTRVCMPGHAQAICDSLRAEILPTLPGHHKYKAQGDVYSATVDALEKELPPDALKARTATLGVLASVDAMRPPFTDRLHLVLRRLDGSRTSAGDVVRVSYDIYAGWVEVRQDAAETPLYPPTLPFEQQPGDYSLTRFQEGAWHVTSRCYGRDGAWKGDVSVLTTPVAIFSDHVSLIPLGVQVAYGPQQVPEISGLDVLQSLQQQRLIGSELVQKIQEESQAVLENFRQQAQA